MKLIPLILLALILTSCTDSEDGYYTFFDQASDNYISVESTLKKAQFTCESSQECPENVGMMFINIDNKRTNSSIGQCTGFLIDHNIVATNAHCIPADLKRKGANCEERIAIRFQGNQPNTFRCKKIIDYSADKTNALQADYAFFELTRSTNRAPLTIAKEGISNNQAVVSVKVTPKKYNSDRGGILETRTCDIALGSLLNFYSNDPWAETGVAFGCRAIEGNSGSPLLNQDGEVVGILQARMTDLYMSLLRQNFRKFHLNTPSSPPAHAIFTNLSCVDNSLIPYEKEQALNCKEAKEVTSFDFAKANADGFEQRITDRLNDWIKSLPTIFQYDIKEKKKEFSPTFTLTPVCVVDGTELDQYISRTGLFGATMRIELSFYNEVTVEMLFDHDNQFRLQLDFEIKGNKPSYFGGKDRNASILSLVKRGNVWVGKIEKEVPNQISQMFAQRLRLPYCTN